MRRRRHTAGTTVRSRRRMPEPDRTFRRLRVEIQGAVQGVGFRPFVYRLATELALPGWVINDVRGVFIEVEGKVPLLERFRERVAAECPPRALIQSLDVSWLAPVGYTGFEIRHSDAQGTKTVLVLPDIATCADCLREVFDPADRRFRYPFTNCTNCGPRFTIVQALPYDRPNTTMHHFTMCAECQAEYDNPRDRRFHAQPNACPVCGPQLALWTLTPAAADHPVSTSSPPLLFASSIQGDAALRDTATALRNGQIVAVKGLGGFHLMVDARNAAAIDRLRERKPRRDKPFALMVRDLEQAHLLCTIPPAAAELLTSPEAPIVLLERQPDAPVAENVAPGNPTLGLMLPATPLHHLLLHAVDFPLVATSGNLSDEPICTDEQEAIQRIGHIADGFLVHNRPIQRHVDDSIAWMLDGAPRLLRRARGYAPLPVRMAQPMPTILAVGAHLKNTIALSLERQVFISQHIGDLETPQAMAAFEQVIADFLRLYEAAPVAIAHDLHPDYLSTRWAIEAARSGGDDEARKFAEAEHAQSSYPRLLASAPQRIPIQHHHAHLAACLAEHGVLGPALGVTWDGTGYGLDGTVWGGEFLLGDAAAFQRVAHLRPFLLPGGEAAVKEPRRVGLALLWELYGAAALERDDLMVVQSFRPHERRLLAQMLQRGINTPRTTSAGRLFDGVAGLINLHQQVSFEGQAAMSLEFIADPGEHASYPFPVQQPGTQPSGTPAPLLLDWGPLVEAVLTELRRGVAPGIIAARFHNALVEVILNVAQLIGVPRVALAGGCFQNRRLTERTARRLREAGFEVLLHRQVPPNDGSISLGQVTVAAAQLQRESINK